MAAKSTSSNGRWTDPDKVRLTTETMQRVETARAIDRSRINNLANGGRPYSQQEVLRYQIQVNVNWLELARKLQDATGQINNAFIPSGNYFTCHCEKGDPAKRDEYGLKFTKQANKILKRGKSGRRHHFLMRSRNASVALHGIGPLMWRNDYSVLPRFIPMEDLLIPTDTLIDFSNLSYFAVNLYLTPGELYNMSHGKDDGGKEINPGWNKEAVSKIISDLKTEQGQTIVQNNLSDWRDRPEAIAELFKQNAGYYESDSVPKVKLRAFFYEEPESGEWFQKIVLRDSTPNQDAYKVFIYEGKSAFAEDIMRILHVQIGDNSLVAPLKYHSVRAIGQLLYAPCETLNRLRCQTVQHTFQNLLTWFKINDPADRDRLKQIILSQFGVMPEGATIVPQNERHQIDPRLIQMVMSQMKQNIAENSSSFTPDANDGTNKEMTAFEAKARLQSANAMVSNVLQMMYAQEIFYYQELIRRMLLKEGDGIAKRFQAACKADGIPSELMVPEVWNIVPERVLGAGDNMLAQAQADALMSQKASFDPESQRLIQRTWTATLLDDPEHAELLVPSDPMEASSGTYAAESVFGTLMRGAECHVRPGIDLIGYAARLIEMLTTEVTRAMEGDGMGTREDIIGMATVIDHLMKVLEIMAQDEQKKPLVKQLNDALGQQMNQVKAMAQRQAEAQGMEGQQDTEAQAKANSTMMLAQVKAQIKEMEAHQKQMQRDAQFQQKEEQKRQSHLQSLQQKSQTTEADLMARGAQTGAQVKATEITAQAQAEAARKSAGANKE